MISKVWLKILMSRGFKRTQNPHLFVRYGKEVRGKVSKAFITAKEVYMQNSANQLKDLIASRIANQEIEEERREQEIQND